MSKPEPMYKLAFPTSHNLHEIAEHMEEEHGIQTEYEDEPGTHELFFNTHHDMWVCIRFCKHEYGVTVRSAVTDNDGDTLYKTHRKGL